MLDMASEKTVVEEIQSLLVGDKGITQTQIAREAGISGAALSTYLKGEYAGDNAAMGEKLRQWIETHNKRREQAYKTLSPTDKIDTPSSKKIEAAIEYAHLIGDISLIYGGAGVGKTHTIMHYANRKPNIWVATMTPAHERPKAALEEIAFELEIRIIPKSGARLLREINRRIRDTQGLLIIDEAQHLSASALESIRSIHDATGIGIVFCGNETVYSQITGGGGRSANFAQLFSRIGKRLRLKSPLKGDIDGIANGFGVDGKDEIEELRKIGQNPGALRIVVKTLRLASVYAVGANSAITHKTIRAAWRSLSGVGND